MEDRDASWTGIKKKKMSLNHIYCVGFAEGLASAARNASNACKHPPIVTDEGVGATNKLHF